jgi:hypothetical protein
MTERAPTQHRSDSSFVLSHSSFILYTSSPVRHPFAPPWFALSCAQL